jgi:hypothetical protein
MESETKKQRMVYDKKVIALIIFGVELLKEKKGPKGKKGVTSSFKDKQDRFNEEMRRLRIEQENLRCLTFESLRWCGLYRYEEGILYHGEQKQILPAKQDFHRIITSTIRNMHENPTEQEVSKQVQEKYSIPTNVLKVYFGNATPVFEGNNALVPAQHGRGGGRVVHLNGGDGGEPRMPGNLNGGHVMANGSFTTLLFDSLKDGNVQNLFLNPTFYNAPVVTNNAETIHSSGSGGGNNGGGATKEEVERIITKHSGKLVDTMNNSHKELGHMLGNKLDTGIEGVKNTFEQSAVKAPPRLSQPRSSQKIHLFGSPLGASPQMLQESPSPEAHARLILPGTTCTESAKDLRWYGENADLCREDGIGYPPEERLSLVIIKQWGTVEEAVQRTRNKLIRLGDACFFLMDAGPFNAATIEDANDQNASMLPSAGMSKSFDINISMQSQADATERELVTFSVSAKSLTDHVCEEIMSTLVGIAVKDGTVGQVSLEGAIR